VRRRMARMAKKQTGFWKDMEEEEERVRLKGEEWERKGVWFVCVLTSRLVTTKTASSSDSSSQQAHVLHCPTPAQGLLPAPEPLEVQAHPLLAARTCNRLTS